MGLEEDVVVTVCVEAPMVGECRAGVDEAADLRAAELGAVEAH